MHFVFLCESYNIYNKYSNIDDVMKLSEKILSDYSYIFKDLGKFNFQLAFFDFCEYSNKMDEILEERRKKKKKK